MNILVVTYHYLNGNGGGIFASRAYINALSEIGDKVTLLVPYSSNNPIEKINPNVKLIPVCNDKSKALKFLDYLLGHVHRFYSIFEQTLLSDNYDLVVFDNSKCSFGLIDIAHKYGKKVITIHHNCEQEYNRDNSTGWLKQISLFWTKRYEGESISKSDLSLTLTEQDKLLFTKLYNANPNRIKVLGCFEFERKEPALAERISTSAKRFVITGNLSAKQTEDSLLPWLETYYPILKKEIPSSSLTIAGKNPTSRIVEVCKQLGIKLVPSPIDMKPILNNSDYYICPTSLGGGIKLRVMDGLKSGMPVLTHIVSLRGYDVFKDKYVFGYDDAKSFVNSLQKIIVKDFDRRNIQKEYLSYFSFESGLLRMKDILSKL